MGFELRLLDKVAYQAVVEALDAFARGDKRLLVPLVARCQAQLRTEEFIRRHGGTSWHSDAWSEHLEKALAGGDDPELSTIVIGLTAMPDYQLSPWGGGGWGPNLVLLGEDDGGLYVALYRFAPWLDPLFVDRFQHDRAPYPYGLSMILFTREDLVRLQRALEDVVADSSSMEDLLTVRDRLADLIRRSLADERTTVAVSLF